MCIDNIYTSKIVSIMTKLDTLSSFLLILTYFDNYIAQKHMFLFKCKITTKNQKMWLKLTDLKVPVYDFE